MIISVLEERLNEIVDLTAAAGRPGDPDVVRDGLRRAVELFDRHGPLLRGLVEAAAVDEEVEEVARTPSGC